MTDFAIAIVWIERENTRDGVAVAGGGNTRTRTPAGHGHFLAGTSPKIWRDVWRCVAKDLAGRILAGTCASPSKIYGGNINSTFNVIYGTTFFSLIVSTACTSHIIYPVDHEP